MGAGTRNERRGDWMSELVYIFVTAFLGMLLGMLLMYLMRKNNKPNTEVKEVQEKLDGYQQEVEKHFAKTADLIDNLTNSYKEVFEHLSESAENLLTEEQIKNQLNHRKSREVTIKYLKGSETESTKIPPDSE